MFARLLDSTGKKLRRKTAARKNNRVPRRSHLTRPLAFEPLEDRIVLSTFTVVSLGDGGAGSLREAITLANSNFGPDTIDFDVAGTINVASQLPTISDTTGGTTIDGTTAPGYAAGAPVVVISGLGAGPSVNGVVIVSANNEVHGLQIDSFSGSGIVMTGSGASGNTLTGNTATANVEGFFLITASNNTLTGNTATANREGFRFRDSSNNTLTENTATGNGREGFRLSAGSSSNDLTRNMSTENGSQGFRLRDSSNNTLTENTATGNGREGFRLTRANDNALMGNTSTGNVLEGFNLAVAPSNNNTLTENTSTGNGREGFRLDQANSNILTGNMSTENGRRGFLLGDASNNTFTANMATGNGEEGFAVTPGSNNNTLTGNTATGNVLEGFRLTDASNNTLTGNTVVGNTLSGVVVVGDSNGNQIRGNSIHSNGGLGIDLAADGVTPNDTDAAALFLPAPTGNGPPASTFTGSGASKIFIESGGQVVVEAENFATRATGVNGQSWQIVPDETAGVDSFSNPRGSYIQALPDGSGNQSSPPPSEPHPSVDYPISISTPGTYRLYLRWDSFSSTSDSIYASILELRDGIGGSQADWYRYSNGPIGKNHDANFATDPWDGFAGFELTSGSGNNVAANWTIATPGIYTVRLDMREDGAAVDAFVLQQVSGLPNNLQNFPVISGVGAQAIQTEITGSLNSLASTTFALDFYSNSVADPSGFGEGEVFLGSADVTTDGAGNVNFSVTLPVAVPAGHFITATATDPAGNTSEFSGEVLLNFASITGTVFVDVNQNGLFEANEPGIDGVIVELLDESGNPVLDGGNPVTATTSDGGFYLFDFLDPATYQLHEIQPTGVDDGAELLGSLGGSIPANDTMQLTLNRIDATDYVFAELGQQVTSGDTATIGFWQNKHGQALITQGGAALADWLTSNFGNVFGNTFSDGIGTDDGAEVATFFRQELFKQKAKKSAAGPAKVDAQFTAVALATYFTSSNLAGNVASSFGFNVTFTGISTNVVNVDDNGAAFGVANGTDLTIMQLLLATNSLTDQPDSVTGFASIYDQDGDEMISSAEAALRAMANIIYSDINEGGAI